MLFYQLFSEAIDPTDDRCIALLGGGGKTALLHKLADEFAQNDNSVLQTSITKTAFHQLDNPIIYNELKFGELGTLSKQINPIFIIGEKIGPDKLLGISEFDLASIRQYFDITIFECDGARNKPIKAHTDYDPRVPDFASHVIIIVGADAVNTEVKDNYVHRPELFCKTWQVKPDQILDIDFIVKVVSTQAGYLSKVPDGVEILYFVNKVDAHQKIAGELAEAIYGATNKPTYYGSVQNNILKQVKNR